MKLSKIAMAAAIAFLVNVGNVSAGDQIQLTSHCSAAPCDCGAPVCGCEDAGGCDTGCAAGGCDSGCATGGCDSGCATGGCDSGCGILGGCDSGCDSGGCDAIGCGCLGGGCNLGDQWTLFGNDGPISIGGWTQIGYHSNNLPLFNNHADRVNLHQQWFYLEKAVDGSNGLDIGGRIDYVYGVDAQDTQSFGIDDDHWDNDWDNGIYGHAIPQLYGEVAYGDLSVKAGHFYTIIGWEVVTAPDNFFYSHAYTMYNSEPFTHTGALATYSASDNLDIFGGYVFGWDSGFEDNGDAFLGGASLGVTDNFTLTYATVGGVFANNDFGGDEKGYMHSLVGDLALSDNLQYIIQHDLLTTEDSAGVTVRDTFGINNYLIYTVNDCMAVGGRLEYWDVSDNPDVGDFDVVALTLGVNYRPHANVIVRPEIRWDWANLDQAAFNAAGATLLENNDEEQTTFGIDTIFLF